MDVKWISRCTVLECLMPHSKKFVLVIFACLYLFMLFNQCLYSPLDGKRYATKLMTGLFIIVSPQYLICTWNLELLNKY